MIRKTLFLFWFQGMLVSGETQLLTWQPDMFWKSPLIRDWRFLTLIFRC